MPEASSVHSQMDWEAVHESIDKIHEQLPGAEQLHQPRSCFNSPISFAVSTSLIYIRPQSTAEYSILS